ncbi:hypothetical protein CPB83DRAFT_830430 [Crepidotus variabilis]|uniref:Uncharacterized protein n=1 Tax=Crepidotus variabilis TaxID=179855 RepID=A0A9P6EUV9_9AGAR|nr:hypothetical protein CPB83DRAFT_830430 [Crepidotus variabilis]
MCGGVVLFATFILWNGGIPPSYADIRAQERSLPQHRWQPQRPAKYITEGPKFIRFPDHYWGLGLNNILEEALLNCHLVQAINRVYVFEDHVWSHLPFPYTIWQWTLRPVRVPLSSFLGGVLVGMDEDLVRLPVDQRSISQEYFDHICPPSDTVEVLFGTERDVPHSVEGVVLPFPRSGASGAEIESWWKTRMNLPDVKDARCVTVNEQKRRLWDWSFYNHVTFLEYFPTLQQSKVFQGFQWSPLVLDAAQRSLGDSFFSSINNSEALGMLLLGRTEMALTLATGHLLNETTMVKPGLPRTVAIHLRMGDFSHHCHSLNNWGAPYLSFALPESQGGGVRDSDVFDLSPFWETPIDDSDAAAKKKAKETYYFAHCLPTISQIVQRLHDVRIDFEKDSSRVVRPGPPGEEQTSKGYWLNKVYILTNGSPAVIQQIKELLLADDWELVTATPDLEKNWSKLEKAVSGATDMSIAEEGEVFVGNGFSSLSANIIMLRRAKGYPPYTHRNL